MKNCIYCETWNKSEHFICERCWVWMCDDCYEWKVEHDSHYHEICNSCDDKEYDIIVKAIWHEPSYICENCVNELCKDI